MEFLFPFCSIETITLGDKRIGIKTSVLEEKATACHMLCCYADELKEGFFPWIDQVNFELPITVFLAYAYYQVYKLNPKLNGHRLLPP